jgi:hypothetical protein
MFVRGYSGGIRTKAFYVHSYSSSLIVASPNIAEFSCWNPMNEKARIKKPWGKKSGGGETSCLTGASGSI